MRYLSVTLAIAAVATVVAASPELETQNLPVIAARDLAAEAVTPVHAARGFKKHNKRGRHAHQKKCAEDEASSGKAHHSSGGSSKDTSSKDTSSDGDYSSGGGDSGSYSPKKVSGGSGISSVTTTWYDKHDLLNPACLPGGGWNPTDEAHVIAVTEVWGTKPKCGSFWKLSAGDKSIVARVMDLCAGCAQGSAHFDLTKSVFSHLWSLDVGLVNGVDVEEVEAPSDDQWSVDLYGPKELN